MCNLEIVTAIFCKVSFSKRKRFVRHSVKRVASTISEYILLLVNPAERTLAIAHSDATERRAHHIRKNKCGEIELHSKGLLKTMLSLSDKWEDNHSYKVYGEVPQGENIMRFYIDNVALTSEKEHDNAG